MTVLPAFQEQRPRALVGASIPRSGHHFLHQLLSNYFSDDLYYCEFYSKADCCKTVPCIKGGQHVVSYQKSHDRQGEVPKDVGEALYVIQYREPVGEALSDRELDLLDRLGRRSLNYRQSRDHYIWWLMAKAAYYRDFHDKWFSPRVANAIYLNYADLASDPAAAVSEIANRTAGGVDATRLEAAVHKAAAVRAGSATQKKTPCQPYTPRQIDASPHYDRDLLAAFEAYVIERCPNYGFASRLDGSYREHPFYGLVLLHDSREPLPDGTTDRLQAAASLAPEHPEIVLRFAKQEVAQGRSDAAIRRLEQLLARNPFFAPGYRVLLNAYEASGSTFPASQLTANAMLACSDSPALLGDLAEIYLEGDMAVSAVAALSLAATLAPDDYRVNHLFAKALACERRWAQAASYAERAAALRPENKGTERLLLRIRKQLGQKTVRVVREISAEA